jgi:hypothetical protein
MSIAAAMIAAGCNGKSAERSAPEEKAARATAPVEARIPEGPVPVALPALAELGRQVSAAKAFVTIAKDGARAAGPLAAGPTPYAGQPVGDVPLDAMLFAGAVPAVPAAPPVADAAPPPSAADAGVAAAPKAPLAPRASKEANAKQARELGLEVASALSDADSQDLAALASNAPRADGGSTPGVRVARMLQVQGVLHAGGKLDALILADAASAAFEAIEVLAALRARTTSIAVAGRGAPDAVPYRFSQVTQAPAQQSVRVSLSQGEARVRDASGGPSKIVPFADGGIVRAQLVAALRDAQRNAAVGPIELYLDGQVTAQQLVDALGAMAAAGVAGLSIITLPPSGGGGVGMDVVIGDGWGVIGTLRSDATSTSRTSPGEPLLISGTGAFDPKIVTRVLHRQLGKIEACYTKRLAAVPALAGTVTARFALSPKGEVSSSTATGVDEEVARCVAGVIEGVQFPPPKRSGVEVAMPFTFQPSASP